MLQLDRHRRFGLDRHLIALGATKDRHVALAAGLVLERAERAIETPDLVGARPAKGKSFPASFKSSFTSAR